MEHKEVGELQNELNREDGSGKTKGFHYTKKSSIEEIGDTLKGVIGDNSEKQFGKEVNPKLFYAYGVDGAIQIFNRNLNIAVGATISFLNDGKHSESLPNTVKEEVENGAKDRNLTPMEGFEYARKDLEGKVLYVFDAIPTKYENIPTSEQVAEVKGFVENFEAVPVVSGDYVMSANSNSGKSSVSIEKITPENSKAVNMKQLIGLIDESIEALQNESDSSQNPELGLLLLKRGELAMIVRDAAMSKLGEMQGREVEEGNVDRFIFNEDKIRLVDIEDRPHNAYTKVTKENNGEYVSRDIGEKDGVALVTNGGKVAKYTDVMAAVYGNRGENVKTTIHGDVDLAELFFKYCKLVDIAKRKHLIKDLEGGPDLEHLDFYGDELAAIKGEIEDASKEVYRMTPKTEEMKHTMLPTLEIDGELMANYQKSSQELVTGLGKPEEFLGKMSDVGAKLENDIRESRATEKANSQKETENDERK